MGVQGICDHPPLFVRGIHFPFSAKTGADLGGGYRGCAPPHPPEMTRCFLIQLVVCKKKTKTMWFIGVEVEQETSAPPPKKNPGSAPVKCWKVQVKTPRFTVFE